MQCYIFANIVHPKCLTDKEKADIVSKLDNNVNVSKIAALLGRYIRTVRKYVINRTIRVGARL